MENKEKKIFSYNSLISDYEIINPEFAKVKIYVCYEGKNRNKSFISKEVLEKMSQTIYGVPIVAEYDKDKETFKGHGGKIELSDKGIDFIARFNNEYVIGEAKFISDEGGHQYDQFLDAMTTLRTPTQDNVISIAILDGVLYIPGKKKMYREITTNNIPVMSALLLRDFLYSL